MKIRPGAFAHVVVSLLFAILVTSSDMAHSQSPKNFAQARRELKIFYEQSMRQHGIVGSGFIWIERSKTICSRASFLSLF